MTIAGPLLAGLGLFFVGVTLVSQNLKQMANRRLRQFFAKFTRRTWQSALVGLVSGFVTQSTSVAAFVVAGLTSSGLMTVRSALPVIFWANAGCSILVIIAVMDISAFIAVMLFISGLSFAFERPRRFRYLSRALFGIGLLFFGLQMVRTGAAPLSDLPIIREALAATQGSNLLAFGLGAVMTMVTQTAVGVILIALAMTKSGLFTLDQTIMLIYGVHLGSAALTWLLSSGLKGTPKQIIMSQVLFNVFGVILMVALFYIEVLGHVPLVKAALAHMSANIDTQMAYLVVLFNWAVPLVSSFAFPLYQTVLNRFWPPTREETLSQLKYIQNLATDSAEAAIIMVEKETLRLFNRLPAYLESARTLLEGGQDTVHQTYHAAFAEVSAEIEAVLSEMANQDLPDETGAELVRLLAVNELISGLEGSINDFCDTAKQAEPGTPLASFLTVLLEAQEFLLMTATDAVSGDTEAARMLTELTSARGKNVEGVRNRYFDAAANAPAAQRAALHFAANLYERTAWVLGRLAQQNTGRETIRPATAS